MSKLRKLGSVLFFFLMSLVWTVSSYGQCKNWDLGEHFAIEQRGASIIGIRLTQKGTTFTGTASTTSFEERTFGKIIRETTGAVEGTIGSDAISFKIFWQGGLTGVYTAKILPTGRLEGETYDKAKPAVIQTWHSAGVLKCPSIKSARETIKPSTKTSGLYKGPKKLDPPSSPGTSTAIPKPTAPTPAPMKVPGIVVTNVLVTAGDLNRGLIDLFWDGGPDHPFAEVWVKMNGGDPTFVVEQGKGTHRLPVLRRVPYDYILTDAGVTLATVRVLIP